MWLKILSAHSRQKENVYAFPEIADYLYPKNKLTEYKAEKSFLK